LRLLQGMPDLTDDKELEPFEVHDTPPR
jgi:hypothetical protein